MKTHTNNFKVQIKELGRELDSLITYTSNNVKITLEKENLNSVTPHYEGNILKSVMKQLDIDSNINIPKNTILNYKLGVKVNENYEYLDFGNYIVYSSEKQEDTNSYKIVCYDKMLYSMKKNEELGITYPIVIRDYIDALCNKIGLVFANVNDEFANYNRKINSELYVGLDYTYRDILDELAQVTASTICINEHDELEIRYINDTKDVIDKEYLKDINVKFGKKYGPINSIVLSRSAESDNIFIKNHESIEENGLCEIKIKDNQIMNWNNRDEYLPDILEKLNGLEFYINDFSSTGICYFELCDRYNVSIDDKLYSCIMFNDEINVTQGLEEFIYTNEPEVTETDYSKADKTDRRINQTNLIVDKQNQTITSLVNDTSQYDERITKTEQTAEEVLQKVSGVYNFTREANGSNMLIINEAQLGNLLELHITGEMELSFLKEDLFLEENQYLLGSFLVIENAIGEKNRIELPIPFLYKVGDISDEFILEKVYNEETKKYESKVKIIRRIIEDSEGNKSIAPTEKIENLGTLDIPLYKGTNKIYLESFQGLKYSVKYAILNEVTEVFANSAEIEAKIIEKENSIRQEVNGKFKGVDDEIKEINGSLELKIDTNKLISEINGSADKIHFEGNRFSWKSDYSSMTDDGKLSCASGDIGGYSISENDLFCEITTDTNYSQSDIQKVLDAYVGDIQLTEAEKKRLDFNGDGEVDIFDANDISILVRNHITKNTSGKVMISANDLFTNFRVLNGLKKEIIKIGLSGIYSEFLSADEAIIEKGNIKNLTYDTISKNSDERLKENIKNLDNKYLNLLKELNPKSFKYKNSETFSLGFIAQEVLRSLEKNQLKNTIVKEKNNLYSIDYTELISILWKSNQELLKRIEKLENKEEKEENETK